MMNLIADKCVNICTLREATCQTVSKLFLVLELNLACMPL